MGRGYLYLARDAGGGVLYVGSTGDIRRRLSEHRRHSAWWPEAEDIEVDEFGTLQAARAAEDDLICRLDPPRNIRGGHGARRPSCSGRRCVRSRKQLHRRERVLFAFGARRSRRRLAPPLEEWNEVRATEPERALRLATTETETPDPETAWTTEMPAAVNSGEAWQPHGAEPAERRPAQGRKHIPCRVVRGWTVLGRRAISTFLICQARKPASGWRQPTGGCGPPRVGGQGTMTGWLLDPCPSAPTSSWSAAASWGRAPPSTSPRRASMSCCSNGARSGAGRRPGRPAASGRSSPTRSTSRSAPAGSRRSREFGERPGQEIDLHRHGYLFLLDPGRRTSRPSRRRSRCRTPSACRPGCSSPAEAAGLAPGVTHARRPRRDLPRRRRLVLTGVRRPGLRDRRPAAGAPACVTGVEVVGLDPDGDEPCGVRTTAGLVRAGAVVCAAGAWSGGRGRAWPAWTCRWSPLRRQILVTEPLPPAVGALAAGVHAHDDRCGTSTFYLHREGPGVLLGMSWEGERPGFGTDYDDAWLPDLTAAMEQRAPGAARRRHRGAAGPGCTR